MTTVFISYSRRDDELFAKRLYKDLTQEGFEVWWDRESLHSVSLSFHQQIKDAIRAKIDRLIYIAGPNAAVSDYVREEWKFALECDKPVIPMLRLGDFDTVPGELSLLHCDDFRDITKYPEQFKKLIANLRRPEPPLGHLFAVPTLPKHFMGRTAFLRRLKDAVQVDLQKPVVITGAASRVGVQGMGGIGKSVLAAAVARDREVRRAYPDGIIWVNFGQTPDIPQLMRDVAKHLGNSGAFENEVQGQGVLRELFLNKAVLFVFDDVWKAKYVQAFDVLGPRCRMLVTTRDAGILHTLHGELYFVELFSEEEALSLLAASAEQAADKLPKQARKIVKECGYLPLAVALCGGMAKKRGGKWESILKRLQRANLEKIADRESINEQHKNIWQAMQISVESLEQDEQERFAELSVFVTDQTIPEAAVRTLWAHTGNLDDLDTEDLLINFSERSLIRIEKESSSQDGKDPWRVSMHDLLYDYAMRISGDKTELNNTLLSGYLKKCSKGWPSGPNDGYFFQNLCVHMIKAAHLDDVVLLLTDISWIEAKCRHGLVFDLQNDYRDVIEVLPEVQEELRQKREHEARVARWTKEIIEYAKKWSDRRKRLLRGETVTGPEPELPEIVPSVNPWSEKRIQTECERILDAPTRLDRLEAFKNFVDTAPHVLMKFGSLTGFTVQHAYNFANSDSIIQAAKSKIRSEVVGALLLRHPSWRLPFNPKPACFRTLEVGDLSHRYKVAVNGMALNSNGLRLITGSSDLILRVWDLESGKCLHKLGGHTEPIGAVAMTVDGRRAVSGGGDKNLMVWDLESGKCLHKLGGHTEPIGAVAMTVDGRRAVSASWNKTLRVWDLEFGKCLSVLELQGSTPIAVSMTADGQFAVSGGGDKNLMVWDLESGKCLYKLGGHTEPIRAVAMTVDGRRVVSGSWGGTLRVWDLESGKCLHKLGGHTESIRAVAMTADGKFAVSGGEDKTLRLWDLETGKCLRVLEGHSEEISAVTITANGQLAVSGGEDNTLRVWNLESGRSLTNIEGHTKDVSAVAMTADGQSAVSASWDKTLRVWDLKNGRCQRTLKGHTSLVFSVAVTPDGRRAVSGGGDENLMVWDLESGRNLLILPGHTGSIQAVAITNDGNRAISGSDDWTLRVWNFGKARCSCRVLHGDGFYGSIIILLLKGRVILTNSQKKPLGLWNIASGQCLKTLEITRPIAVAVPADDSSHLVSLCADKTLQMWDISSGNCLRTFELNGFKGNSLAVSADGKLAVLTSRDKSLLVWDLVVGECIAMETFSGALNCCAMVRDMVVAGSVSGKLEVLQLIRYPQHVNKKLEPIAVKIKKFLGPQ